MEWPEQRTVLIAQPWFAIEPSGYARVVGIWQGMPGTVRCFWRIA
jgi:hypothetical protein